MKQNNENKEYTEVNKVNLNALKRPYLLGGFTQGNNNEKSQVKVELSFENFSVTKTALYNILSGIGRIAEVDQKDKQAIFEIVELTEIATSILEVIPCQFLDELLIKPQDVPDWKKVEFKEIAKL